MKYLFVFLFLISTCSYGQKKLTYNREHVVLPGCEKSINLAECYQTRLLTFIETSLTKEVSDKIIQYSKKDTITIYSRLYFDEKGNIIKPPSKFSTSIKNIKKSLYYLIDKFPKVGPVLDKQNNGVADYVGSISGFRIDREKKILIPIENYQPKEVPLSIIENVPLYKGCSKYLSNKDAKKCMNSAIGKHVGSNFNTNIATKLGLDPGIKKIYVFFIINKKGEVSKIKARAPHPDLEKEAIRIIKLIPKLEAPGMQRGKAVNVPYSLPITFNIEETKAQKKERFRLKRKKKF